MIWATVSSWSCFCWLYRASPSLAAKNIINLISVLTLWWCPCVESSLVLLEEGVCYEQCIFLAKLYSPLPCFIPHSKAKFACYSRCFLTSYFCILVPYNEKDIFFWVLVLKGLVGLHRTVQLQLLQRYWLGYRLGLQWYSIVCLETNSDHSVFFQTASKYCILDSFVDHDGYSISSKGFLLVAGDIISYYDINRKLGNALKKMKTITQKIAW